MFSNASILLAIIFVLLAGSFILPLAGRVSVYLRNALSLLFALIPLALLASLIPACINGQVIQYNLILLLGFNFIIYADALAVFRPARIFAGPDQSDPERSVVLMAMPAKMLRELVLYVYGAKLKIIFHVKPKEKTQS